MATEIYNEIDYGKIPLKVIELSNSEIVNLIADLAAMLGKVTLPLVETSITVRDLSKPMKPGGPIYRVAFSPEKKNEGP